MEIKVLRHMLVNSNVIPSRPGAVVSVDDSVGKELIASGLATQAPADDEKTKPLSDAAPFSEAKAVEPPANKKAAEPQNKSGK